MSGFLFLPIDLDQIDVMMDISFKGVKLRFKQAINHRIFTGILANNDFTVLASKSDEVDCFQFIRFWCKRIDLGLGVQTEYFTRGFEEIVIYREGYVCIHCVDMRYQNHISTLSKDVNFFLLKEKSIRDIGFGNFQKSVTVSARPSKNVFFIVSD